MNLPFAQRCADRLIEWLSPHCDAIAVAGSVRRQRPSPGDIDLIAIPKRVEERDMFGAVTCKRNAAWVAIDARATLDGWRIQRAGADYVSWLTRDIQVDLWWAEAHTWGTHLLCKTGSKEHNIWLAQYALSRGAKWHPTAGLYQANHRVSETEEAIYQALGLDPIPPQRREAQFLPFAGLIRAGSHPV